MATFTSREFNHDVTAAKRAAASGPVVITDRGTPAHVLLTYEHYQSLRGRSRNLSAVLRMDGADVDFDPGRVDMELRPADP